MVGLASGLGEVMSVTPSFQGEVQFRRYSDTSTQGQQVVFAVQDREALESFVGMEGKRFMAVLVQIGDDEQPAQVKREYLGDLCYRAVQWCNDPEFQEWIRKEARISHAEASAELAKTIVISWCQVKSRKELDEIPSAGQAFREQIVGPWQKYQMARRSA